MSNSETRITKEEVIKRRADIEKKIHDLEKRLNEAKADLDKEPKLYTIEDVALKLHTLYCHANHIDDCGWYYEYSRATDTHDWSGNSHAYWLNQAQIKVNKARAVGVTIEQLMELI